MLTPSWRAASTRCGASSFAGRNAAGRGRGKGLFVAEIFRFIQPGSRHFLVPSRAPHGARRSSDVAFGCVDRCARWLLCCNGRARAHDRRRHQTRHAGRPPRDRYPAAHFDPGEGRGRWPDVGGSRRARPDPRRHQGSRPLVDRGRYALHEMVPLVRRQEALHGSAP